jgi:CheY-like chemotaxis protein
MASQAAKILVVEDDADAADVTKTVLEHQGYQVRVAGSPDQAWAALRAQPADLILLDIMMPSGTEGFHFVWNLRQAEDAALREIPIIVISAIHDGTPLRFYPDQSDGTYQPGEYLPVQAFLDKPAEPEKLLAEIARVLKGRAASK